jgi:hypothetical protein
VVIGAVLTALLCAGWIIPSTTPASAVVPGSYAASVGISPRKGTCSATTQSTLKARLKELTALGVSFIRCDLNWWTVQPNGPTDWQWSQSDNLVAAAAAAHLDLLFVLAYTPPWARPSPLPSGTINPSHVPPVNMSDYINFVTAAAQRYSQFGVHMWEVWNEENLASYWNPVNPTQYGQYVVAAANAIHGVNANATVIIGGLVVARDINGNMTADEFLSGVGQQGGLNVVDGVGFHPYPAPQTPTTTCCNNPIGVVAPKVHNVMTFFGAGNKKIWATETGWPTSSQSQQTINSSGTQMGTEQWQATEMPILLKTWFNLSYGGPLVIYDQRDDCTDNTNKWCKMGLERSDGSQKPAWSVVQQKLLQPVGS